MHSLFVCPLLERAIALEGDLGAGVGFLQFHAPVAQVGQRDRFAGDGAAHIVTGSDDLELAVKVAQPRLAFEAEQPFKPIHALSTSAPVIESLPGAAHHSATAPPMAVS